MRHQFYWISDGTLIWEKSMNLILKFICLIKGHVWDSYRMMRLDPETNQWSEFYKCRSCLSSKWVAFKD